MFMGNSPSGWGIEGNVLFGLITQRSKVQILPRNQYNQSVTGSEKAFPNLLTNRENKDRLNHHFR